MLKTCDLLNKIKMEIKHITPAESSLSITSSSVVCDREGCNKTFKNSSVLHFHQSQFHDHQRIKKKSKEFTIEERYHCPVKDCLYFFIESQTSRFFTKLQYLKQHYLKVHAVCTYSCELCGKSFSLQSFLNTHLCNQNLQCSCDQNYSSISSLQTHVRRTGHKAEILQIYQERMKENKEKKKLQKSKALSNIKRPNDSSIESVSKVPRALHPKPPPHLVAAIALSELAFAGLKKVATIDVGIQTDAGTVRRSGRKFASSSRSRDTTSSRRLATAETETQTRLTHRRERRRRATRRQPPPEKGSSATQTSQVAAAVPLIPPISFDLFTSRKEISIQTGVDANLCDAAGKEEDEDENCFLMFPRDPHRRSVALGDCGRSSSIETQTEVDALLWSAGEPEHEEPNPAWSASIETQTCEPWADIEPFLCSDSHTQTPADTNELFPELGRSFCAIDR